MELVKIQLECSREAARTLLPLLLKARESAHVGESKWYCFFADGENGFGIGDINFENEDIEKNIVLHEDVASQRSLWKGGAIFVYELDGEIYEHKEQDVVFSDATE